MAKSEDPGSKSQFVTISHVGHGAKSLSWHDYLLPGLRQETEEQARRRRLALKGVHAIAEKGVRQGPEVKQRIADNTEVTVGARLTTREYQEYSMLVTMLDAITSLADSDESAMRQYVRYKELSAKLGVEGDTNGKI